MLIIVQKKLKIVDELAKTVAEKAPVGSLEANHRYLPTVCEGEYKEECLPATFSQVARARFEYQTVGAPDSG